MEVAFWLAAGVVLYTYAGYPVLIVLAAWLRPAPLRREDSVLPAASVVIVVHNEEAHLEAKLRNALALDYPRERLEILVVSDGSIDRTEDIATSFAAEGVRLISLPGPAGKATALNAALPQTRGEILVLTDARQSLSSGAARELVAYFAEPTVGAVCGELLLHAPADAPAGGLGVYWSYEKLLRRAESRFDSNVQATGALYAVRRSLVTELDPRTILDDMALPMEVVLAGRRVVFAPEAWALDEIHASPAHEYRRKVRTLAGNFQLVALRPALLDPFRNRLFLQLVSHKLARLAVPWCLLALLVLSAALAWDGRPLYAGLFAVQAAFYLLAVVGALAARAGRSLSAASLPFAFVLGNLAAAHALVSFLRGSQRAAWKAPA